MGFDLLHDIGIIHQTAAEPDLFQLSVLNDEIFQMDDGDLVFNNASARSKISRWFW